MSWLHGVSRTIFTAGLFSLFASVGCDGGTDDSGCTGDCERDDAVSGGGGGAGNGAADSDSDPGDGFQDPGTDDGVGAVSGADDDVTGTGGDPAGMGGEPEPAAGGMDPASGGAGQDPSGGGNDDEPTGNAGGGADGVGAGGTDGQAGAGAEPEPPGDLTDGGAGGASEPEPSVPPEDEEPSSSRLTAVPIGSTDATLGYWEYLPPGYGDEPMPLLVFTHGGQWAGEGTEETLQDVLDVGPPNVISTDAWPNDRPFIVLAPQNPRAGCFDPNDIYDFYNYAVETYSVDRSRIYHTGQSCGAIGAWGYLAEHLDEFVTAAVLIAGDGNDAVAQAGCDLGRIAFWGFHNADDSTIPPSGTEEPMATLLECDPVPDVQVTIYDEPFDPTFPHDAWTVTYDLSAGHDIYSWFLDHTHP